MILSRTRKACFTLCNLLKLFCILIIAASLGTLYQFKVSRVAPYSKLTSSANGTLTGIPLRHIAATLAPINANPSFNRLNITKDEINKNHSVDAVFNEQLPHNDINNYFRNEILGLNEISGHPAEKVNFTTRTPSSYLPFSGESINRSNTHIQNPSVSIATDRPLPTIVTTRSQNVTKRTIRQHMWPITDRQSHLSPHEQLRKANLGAFSRQVDSVRDIFLRLRQLQDASLGFTQTRRPPGKGRGSPLALTLDKLGSSSNRASPLIFNTFKSSSNRGPFLTFDKSRSITTRGPSFTLDTHTSQNTALLELDKLRRRRNKTNECPKLAPETAAINYVSTLIVDWKTQEMKRPSLRPGGRWSPSHCEARSRVAILVPYRRRIQHLHIFINYMHPFLQKQDLDYGIYVVEQAGTASFNRGKLLNIGFKEAMADYDWDCVVLHDVDNLPVNDLNFYDCPHRPKHLSSATEKFDFELPYHDYFGGVTSLRTDHYRLINGMSNEYWGWGAEDDDLYRRCKARGLTPEERNPLLIGKYRSLLKHHHSAQTGADRMQVLEAWEGRHFRDGLSNLQYTTLKKQSLKLFKYIVADIGRMS